MSRLTDYGENQLVDFTRGQSLDEPSSWWISLLSAASDSAQTELAGTGYGRVEVVSSLTAWLSTQGNTLASTGTSHATSNAELIDFGTAGSGWGTWSHIGLHDDEASGNCWMYLELPDPIVINSSDPVSIVVGALRWTLGLTGGCSDYLANQLIDKLFRGQTYSWPATLYHRLLTAAPSNAGGGTEVSGGSYARVARNSTLALWSATNAPGTTDLSTGTGGRSSNNTDIIWPAPTANWGTAGWTAENDASSGGNLLFWAPLASPVTVNSGASAPRMLADSYGRTFA